MRPKHVKEAFRLLNKSIIRVETPDINLEQEEEMEEEQQNEEGTATQQTVFHAIYLLSAIKNWSSLLKLFFFFFSLADNIPNGVNGHVPAVNGHVNGKNGDVNGHPEPSSQSKPSLRLSFNEYKRISNLLVLHLRRVEEGKLFVFFFCFFYSKWLKRSIIFSDFFISYICSSPAAEEEEELKKSAVVNWYLKEIESEIDSEEELVNRKGMIEKVIQRLVDYVSGHLLQCTIFFF